MAGLFYKNKNATGTKDVLSKVLHYLKYQYDFIESYKVTYGYYMNEYVYLIYIEVNSEKYIMHLLSNNNLENEIKERVGLTDLRVKFIIKSL